MDTRQMNEKTSEVTQAIILVAGRGTRLEPWTKTMPKALVPVNGVPLLVRVLCQLPKSIKDVVLVIGHKGNVVREMVGNEFEGRAVRYVTQRLLTGTAPAVMCAEQMLALDRSFLFCYGDDLVDAVSLRRACERGKPCLLVAEVSTESARTMGVVVLRADNSVERIDEKPEEPRGVLVSVAGMVLPYELFDGLREAGVGANKPLAVGQGEQLLARYIATLANRVRIGVERVGYCLPVNNWEQLEAAERYLPRVS